MMIITPQTLLPQSPKTLTLPKKHSQSVVLFSHGATWDVFSLNLHRTKRTERPNFALSSVCNNKQRCTSARSHEFFIAFSDSHAPKSRKNFVLLIILP